jgi:DNA-binding beta-propeller fold protein YncE
MSALTAPERALALVAMGLVVVTGCGGASPRGSTHTGLVGSSAAGAQGCPKHVRLLAAAPLRIGRGAGPLAVQGGAVWVARPQADTITQVTPAGRRILRTGSTPISLAVGSGKLWVAERDANRVASIDARTLSRVTVSELSVPVSVITSQSGVWALSLDAGTVSPLNPISGAVSEPLDAPVVDPSGMIMVGDDLWILGAGDHGLSPLNVKLGRIVRTGFDLPGRPLSGLSSDGATIWLGDTAKRALLRVDARTVAVQELPAPENMQPVATAAGRCGVWVADSTGDLALVDPRTAAPLGHSIHVGRSIAALASSGMGLWVTDPADGTLVRVDIAAAG